MSSKFSNEDSSSSSEPKKPKSKFSLLFSRIWSSIRPNFFLDHLDYTSFKVVFTTWFQVWLSVILLVVPATSEWLGAAAYLFQILGFLAVCGGQSVIVNTIVTLLSLMFVVGSWLFAVIAQLIGNRIRGSPSVNDVAKELINEGVCTESNISTCLSQQVYTGRYLETRVTVVFVFAFIICQVFIGMLTRLHPIVRIPWILGVITICITICYSVFWPTFLPWATGQAVIKVMLFALAYKLVISLVIFPELSSSKYFDGAITLLQKLESESIENFNFFKSVTPSHDNFKDYEKFSTIISGIRRAATPLESFAATAKFEISFGRLSVGSLGEIRSNLKNLIAAFSEFIHFYQLIDERKSIASGNYLTFLHFRRRESLAMDSHAKIFGVLKESYKSVGNYETAKRENVLRKRLQSGQGSFITIEQLDFISEVLTELFCPYFETLIDGFPVIISWLQAANTFRTYSLLPGRYKVHIKKQQQLQNELKAFQAQLQTRSACLNDHKTFESFVHDKMPDGETMLFFISQSSLCCYFLQQQFSIMEKIIEVFVTIDEVYPKPRFFTYFSHSLYDNASNFFLRLDDEYPHMLPFTYTPDIQTRNPDALPMSNVFHKLGAHLVYGYKLFLNEHLWFWIRSACLSTICAVPYFCRTTAHWYFLTRLIWIVIMCALSTSEYTGQTIYVIGARVVYSFIGCLVGMVAWYISTGNGSGNYYGYAVVTAVLYIYLVFHRHYSQHSTILPGILLGLTASLVLGTSWVDSSYNETANIGYGFRVAYIRFISVVVGLCIGFIASLVPRPKNSKEAIRIVLSRVIEEIGNIHSDVATFGYQRLQNPSIHIVSRHDPITQRFRVILLKMASIAMLLVPIKHEIPFLGEWPASKYEYLQSLITEVVQLYSVLHGIFDKVEDTQAWLQLIIERLGWNIAELNADLMALIHMSAGSLRSKTPLPKVTKATLSLQHLECLQRQWGTQGISFNERFYRDMVPKEEQEMEEELEPVSVSKEEVEMESEPKQNVEVEQQLHHQLHRSMKENLDYQKLFSRDGNLNVVSLIIAHLIYKKMDEIGLIIKSLVGEKYDFPEGILNGEKEKEKQS